MPHFKRAQLCLEGKRSFTNESHKKNFHTQTDHPSLCFLPVCPFTHCAIALGNCFTFFWQDKPCLRFSHAVVESTSVLKTRKTLYFVIEETAYQTTEFKISVLTLKYIKPLI